MRVLAAAIAAIGCCLFLQAPASAATDCEAARLQRIGQCAQQAQARAKPGDFSYYETCTSAAEPAYKQCVASACAGLGPSCRTLRGAPADFRGQAGSPEDNVYRSCQDKQREGYILEPDEIDHCGGLARRRR